MGGYGTSISSDGETVAVGASQNDSGGSEAGHVRVFKYDKTGSTWVQLGNDIIGAAAGDHAGLSTSISADGKTVAVGAYKNDSGGNEAGHVRVYTLPAANTCEHQSKWIVKPVSFDFNITRLEGLRVAKDN